MKTKRFLQLTAASAFLAAALAAPGCGKVKPDPNACRYPKRGYCCGFIYTPPGGGPMDFKTDYWLVWAQSASIAARWIDATVTAENIGTIDGAPDTKWGANCGDFTNHWRDCPFTRELGTSSSTTLRALAGLAAAGADGGQRAESAGCDSCVAASVNNNCNGSMSTCLSDTGCSKCVLGLQASDSDSACDLNNQATSDLANCLANDCPVCGFGTTAQDALADCSGSGGSGSGGSAGSAGAATTVPTCPGSGFGQACSGQMPCCPPYACQGDGTCG